LEIPKGKGTGFRVEKKSATGWLGWGNRGRRGLTGKSGRQDSTGKMGVGDGEWDLKKRKETQMLDFGLRCGKRKGAGDHLEKSGSKVTKSAFSGQRGKNGGLSTRSRGNLTSHETSNQRIPNSEKVEMFKQPRKERGVRGGNQNAGFVRGKKTNIRGEARSQSKC